MSLRQAPFATWDRWTYHPNLCLHSPKLPAHDVDKFIDHVNSMAKRHGLSVVDIFMARVELRKQHTESLSCEWTDWLHCSIKGEAYHSRIEVEILVKMHYLQPKVQCCKDTRICGHDYASMVRR